MEVGVPAGRVKRLAGVPDSDTGVIDKLRTFVTENRGSDQCVQELVGILSGAQ